VAAWVGRTAGADPENRWRAFGALLSAPLLPRDLAAPAPALASP